MSLSLSLAATATPVRVRRTLLQNLELGCFLFLMLNQVVGVLNPPEAFFLDPQAYAQDLGGVGRAYPFTTAISHLSEVFAIFLLLRHWKAYLGIIRRSPLIFFQVSFLVGSTFWSISPADSLRSSVHYVIDYLLALHIVYSYSVIGFTGLVVRLSAIGVLISFIVLAAFPSVSHEIALGAYSGFWRGAYENKNYLGATASISVVVAAFSLLSTGTGRGFALLVMLGNMALLVGSGSSTSLVATSLCLAILCAVGSVRKPSTAIFTAIVGLGAFCFLLAALMSVHDPFAIIGRDSTMTGRTGVWHAVMPLIKRRLLLGYGLGFWDIDSDFRNDVWTAAGWYTPHAHNDYLDLTLQAGIFSLGIVISNYLLCIYWSVRAIWRHDEGALLCLMLILNFMIRGMSETLTTAPATPQIALLYVVETYLWLAAGRRRGSQVADRMPTEWRSAELRVTRGERSRRDNDRSGVSGPAECR